MPPFTSGDLYISKQAITLNYLKIVEVAAWDGASEGETNLQVWRAPEGTSTERFYEEYRAQELMLCIPCPYDDFMEEVFRVLKGTGVTCWFQEEVEGWDMFDSYEHEDDYETLDMIREEEEENLRWDAEIETKRTKKEAFINIPAPISKRKQTRLQLLGMDLTSEEDTMNEEVTVTPEELEEAPFEYGAFEPGFTWEREREEDGLPE